MKKEIARGFFWGAFAIYATFMGARCLEAGRYWEFVGYLALTIVALW